MGATSFSRSAALRLGGAEGGGEGVAAGGAVTCRRGLGAGWPAAPGEQVGPAAPGSFHTLEGARPPPPAANEQFSRSNRQGVS